MMTHLDHERPRQERVKCVVVGDSGVGKTRLICARAKNTKYTLKDLCSAHVPTVWAIDQYHQHQEVLENSWEMVDDVNCTLRLWDTFGCHDKDRKFAFGRSDVVALCFSVTSATSLRHCVDKWWPEIRRFLPKTPIVLIACRNDMRHVCKAQEYTTIVPDERRRIKDTDILLPEKGRAVAQQIGAVAYYETSALSGYGVRLAFTNAIRAALVHRRHTRFWSSHLRHVQSPDFQSPFLIPPPALPETGHQTSAYYEDWVSLANNAVFADVEFVCSDEVTVYAHRILLAAASRELDALFSSCELSDADSSHSCFARLTSISSQLSNSIRLTMKPEFDSLTLRQLVYFLYCGTLEMTPETVQPLQTLSKSLQLTHLTKIITNRLSGDETDESNTAVIEQFMLERNRKLYQLTMDSSNKYADIILEVDDGKLGGNRALLSQRSAFMSAMLNGNFSESQMRSVKLGDMNAETMRHCLHYIYLDTCPQPSDVYSCMEVVAAADRFCMPRLMDLIQELVVENYLAASRVKTVVTVAGEFPVENGVAQLALELLEPAEAFHAVYLYQWCCNYIITHYAHIHRHHLPLLRSLSPIHQAMLARQRWPPVWYITEYDVYEYSLERRRMEMLEAIRKRRSRFVMALRTTCDMGTTSHFRPPTPPRDRAVSEPPHRRSVALARWKMLLCSR